MKLIKKSNNKKLYLVENLGTIYPGKIMKIYREFEPIVSVILPTYNRSSYLERSVNSVINQTYKNWELLIVDDGSTDGTGTVVATFIEKFNNIRYIKHSNRKISLTINSGILAAAGEFVTFLGSDDEYKPDHLGSRMELFRADPSLDFVHGGIEIIGNPYVKDKNDLSREIHINECVVGATFFARKKLFIEEEGFKDIAYSEDSDFYEKISGRYNITKVELPTYIYYRDTPDSICNTVG